ncbi:MAG: DUF4292 domain-containing protein [Tannerellaceae bacterium]|nr:DUF4292 domain-containing protein [Tannerellaceae bacterium]MCD8262734.1 DUF4292 domain-containing protein [Tannerellaceae bacterium]
MMRPELKLKLLYTIFVVTAIYLSGCSSLKRVGTVAVTGVKEQQELFDSMQEQAFQFRTLTARLNVDLDMPGNSFSSKVDLKMIKDSVFQLSVQPILGIEMVRIELTTDSIKLLDRINKRYVEESYATMKGQTPIEFNFYNLQALFVNYIFLPGEQGLDNKQYDKFQISKLGNRVELRTFDSMGLLYTFFADGEEKLLSTHISDETKIHGVLWDYADFRVVDDQIFPMQMTVRVLAEGVKRGGMNISYSRIQRNIPVKMDFSIPDKYNRITFEQILKSFSNK